MINDTIVALSSVSTQAISVIRLSGEQAKTIANQVLKKDISKQKANTIIHNHVLENGKLIDEVLVSFFKAPYSYTGQDVVEINIHGGRFIGNKIVTLLMEKTARLANPGEFTQRAYLNGKLDLTQAEAINDLILANTDYNASKAIDGLSKSISKMIEPLLEEILSIITNIEVNIDYPEYDDVADLSNNIILPKVEKWQKDIETIIDKSEKSLLLKQGILTVIIGEPNVGKSSLLNALLMENRALVSDIAGTTRDYLEGEIVIDQLHLRLIDTAGLHKSADNLEKMGMEKTQQLIDKAHLVILVLDASKEISKQEKQLVKKLQDKQHIIVYNKKDLNPKLKKGIQISAINGDIESLLKEIKKRYDIDELRNTNTLLSQRQVGLMKQANVALINALAILKHKRELELVAIDLNEAYQSLCDILGRYSRIDLLDSIFQNFCLGK